MKGNKGKGVFAVFAVMVIFLVAILIFAHNSKSERGYYRLIGVFPNSAGLSQGQEINCLGQKIGYIKKTELQVLYRRVVVTMLIENKTRIPMGSTLEVNVNSLLGNKSLAIIPPKDSLVDAFCQPNDTLPGKAPATLTEIQNQASALIDTITDKIHQIDISGLNQTVKTFQHAASQIDTAIGDLRPQLDSTIYNANQLITTYRQAGGKIETTIATIDSLAHKGSKSLDSLPALLQKSDSAANAIKTFFRGLNRFFKFHD
jgi:ABC-type transporter Mla subunit MlaD